jgi:thiol-disulfide isomerase/thioredoxin
MQKNLILAFITVLFLNCSNSNDNTPEPETTQIVDSGNPAIGCTDANAKNFKTTATTEDCSCQYDFLSSVSTSIPNDFTRKILIEEHTGTWCGWCPMAKETMRKLSENQRVIGVEIHYNDEMTDAEKFYNPLKSKYGSPAFPSGMINRRKSIVGTTFIIGTDDWAPNVDDYLKTEKTSVGLAIDSRLNGKNLEVLSHLNFKSSTSDKYGLGIYLVEDKVTGYPQLNYLARNAQFQRFEAYKLPALIENIEHHNVSRDAITPILNGLEIPLAATKDGKTFRKLFKTTLPNSVKKPENCYIIAFIVNNKTGEIINVQKVAIGKSKSWD